MRPRSSAKMPLWGVALILVFFIAAVLFAIRAVAYVGTPARPFGFYYDLGVNDIATSYMRRAIRSWPDFLDNVGWASWGDVPNFNFNPSLSYFILVPLANVIGNEWQAVKSVQVFQQIVALLSMAALYATLRGRDLWAIAAGLLYAALPATALMIRGNVDIGWVVALTPLSIVLAYRMVRRFGVWALPLCGAICGFFGFCFAAEYLFLSSIPIYLFVCVLAFRRTQIFAFALMSILGLVCVGTIGAFFTLPTAGDQALFSDSALRLLALQGGRELALFSESVPTLFALIPREFVLSDVAAFNAGDSLSFVYLATFAVWVAAIWSAYLAVRSPSAHVARTALVFGILLVFVSLGTSLPFGRELWRVFVVVPGFAMVRTPDRFVIVPFVLLTLATAAALGRLSTMGRPAARYGAVVLFAGILASFYAFDAREHCLSLDKSADYIEPDLTSVGATVDRAGGRTISYAFVRSGSQFYTPSYGVPTPTIWYFWDPASHYATDGLGGYGIFTRGAVHTVIASPNWSLDSPNLPAAPEIERAFRGPILFAGKSGVIVKRIGDRSDLSVAQSICIVGGPGLLDWADALPQLRGFAFVREVAPCARHAYLNYDPRDTFQTREIASYQAGPLFGDEPPLRDADYPFVVGRVFINDRWYRDSIDGDDVQSLGGSRNLTHGRSFVLSLPADGDGRPRTLLLRLASRVATRLVARDTSGWSGSIDITPRNGMQWYSIRLPHNRSSEKLALHIGSFPIASGAGNWSGIAFDRAAVVENAAATAGGDEGSHGGSQDAALFSIASMLEPSSAQVPRSSKRVKASGRIWIPAGKFTVHVYAAGLVERRPGLTVDGRSLGSDESFTRPGYHNVVVADVRADDRVLAFIGTGASSQTLEPAKTIKYSTFDWRLTNERTSTLELASFEDGQWLLDDAETGRHVASGVRCDLVDTCFVDVPPGDYRVHHTWQPLLKFGFITTAVTAILAVSVLFASVALRRRALRGLPQKSILSLG